MKLGRKFKRTAPALDVTPMADMVFLLLIFFMLSSAFLVEPGIKLKLPKTKTAEIQAEQKLIISIKDTGEIFLNDKKIVLENLERELRAILPLQKEKLVIIRADKNTKHGVVVEVLDRVKLAGCEKLAIATTAMEEKHK
ncbi:MAG: biopolymer transporter ExbD [Elusimicrobiota bacterium]|nr:biopolymer transporter ExbD [Elusimicrobiota bacterium]